MAKFKLQPDPTFKAKVAIPVPGEVKDPEVEFTFKFRDSDELQSWWEQSKEKELVLCFLEAVVGWELSDEFNEDNLRLLGNRYMGSLHRILETYWREFGKALEKN